MRRNWHTGVSHWSNWHPDDLSWAASHTQTEADVNEAGHPEDLMGIGGFFTVWCEDAEGNEIWRERAGNIIPDAALNDILGVYFAGGQATVAWYMGLVDNAGFSAFVASDTAAAHPGWTENIGYSLATRPVWTPGAATAKSITNPTASVFPMIPTGTAMIRGFFLASSNVTGGNTGILAAEASLPSPQPVNAGDTIRGTYTVNATTT